MHFDYRLAVYDIGWTVPVSLLCRPWKYNEFHFYQVYKHLRS